MTTSNTRPRRAYLVGAASLASSKNEARLDLAAAAVGPLSPRLSRGEGWGEGLSLHESDSGRGGTYRETLSYVAGNHDPDIASLIRATLADVFSPTPLPATSWRFIPAWR
jgi:hypothetical protein